ncbi:S8 family peptidase [Marilutibacter alkalisoli]|uniref:S8 family peptidase n=1 Tax=Marilutibacter alkalisoli TaxID=2591633 RepID=A0A514BMU8_9GAMM|nr:S8 family peptidase [Lysobacter alkalisoli]QDH68718.1 S8 family peptidase [Lysobacter alkalisoli]
MKIKTALLAAAIGASLSLGAAQAAVDINNTQQRFVVSLKAGADTDRVLGVLYSHGIDIARVLKSDEGDSIAVNVDMRNLPDLRTLQAQLPEVDGVMVDVVRRLLDVPAAEAAYDDVTLDGETIPWGIQAVQAQEVMPGGGAIKVCIIDTGYALGHEDLQTAGVDGQDRGAGAWDGSDGSGLHDHGTHVAGTIAALGGNGKGVVGVVEDGSLDLHIVRLFDAQGGFVYATDLAGAMQDCADAGSNVISMSLGGDFSSKAEDRMVSKLNRKGVLLIAAAGNGGSVGGFEPKGDYATFSYPASYDAVMSIAALDSSLQRASFSQYTSQVELTAPGVNVLSTLANGGYGNMSGTSMATPHVAAVAALVWSHYPQCSNNHIRDALKRSALDLGEPGYDYKNGWGLVQAKAAVDYLAVNACKGK